MAVNPDYDLSVYANILKVEDGDDGTSYVYGLATDTGEDLDKQGCDQAWLNLAIPEWYNNWGNIREMHKGNAVGTAKDLQIEPEGFYIGAKVIDAEAVKKVREGVYKGFSIGIKSPVVVRDARYKGGLIKGGKIVEVSLVDHPANERAKFTLVKGAELEKALPPLTDDPDALNKEFKPFTKADDKDDGNDDKPDGDGDEDDKPEDSGANKDDQEKGKRTFAAQKGAEGDNMDAAAVQALVDAAVEQLKGDVAEGVAKAIGITPDTDLTMLIDDKVKAALADIEPTLTAAVTKSLGIAEDSDLTTLIGDTIKTVLTEQPELVKAAAIGDEGEEGTLAERVKSLEADMAEIGATAADGKAYLGAALQKREEDNKIDPEIERKRDLYKSLETHRDPAVREDARVKLAALGE